LPGFAIIITKKEKPAVKRVFCYSFNLIIIHLSQPV